MRKISFERCDSDSPKAIHKNQIHHFETFGTEQTAELTNPIEFNESYNPNSSSIKAFTMKERQKLNTQKKTGKSYINTKDCLLNINENSASIEKSELTRARFMVCIRRRLHEVAAMTIGEGDRFNFSPSPLVFKVNFSSSNTLKNTRFLMGNGFQYKWRVFTALNERN